MIKQVIYKDRLSFLKNNNSFIDIPLIQKKHSSIARFSNSPHNISAIININPIIINPSKIKNFDNYVKNCPMKYSNICSYGISSDNFSPDEKYYMFEAISIYFNKNKLSIPNTLLKDLYIPNYAVQSGEAFDKTKMYFNPVDNHTYLMSTQGDITGLYSVVYEIIDEKQIKRYVWSEDL